jgi:formate dehydrogenase iron-sulfur subunit
MMTRQNKAKLSRRAFLKKAGAGAAGMILAQLLAGKTRLSPASAASAESGWGMLIDLTRCVGCNACALACKASNHLPNDDVVPQALDSDAYTFIDSRQVSGAEGQTEQRYIKRQCMHCLNPACVAACPAAAMYKSETGAVVYRPERCLGCRYCQMACPFEVPSFEWGNGLTPVIGKCWLCYERPQEGHRPACIEACPTGALRFGRREELLAQAHAQIASNPGRYVDHVFGEFEVGGTSILYLSDIPFQELGFPTNLPHTAPPEETEKIMHALPAVLVSVAALMAGTAAYTHRKSSSEFNSSESSVPNPEPRTPNPEANNEEE